MKPYALILSNDIVNPEEMLRVTGAVRSYVDGVKIGITSSMVPGVDIFARARDRARDDTVILADYKVADIGFQEKDGSWNGTNEKIIRELSTSGVNYITCHTIPGISSIEESVKTAHAHGVGVLTLPYMTHKGANLFFGMPFNNRQRKHVALEIESYGIKKGVENQWLWNDILFKVESTTDVILALGNHFGVDGFIGPANNPDVLRRYRYFTESEIWSPGFGRQDRQGRDLETQIREWAEVVGPNSAMIVGSLIYKANDPAAAAREVMEIRDKVVSEL